MTKFVHKERVLWLFYLTLLSLCATPLFAFEYQPFTTNGLNIQNTADSYFNNDLVKTPRYDSYAPFENENIFGEPQNPSFHINKDWGDFDDTGDPNIPGANMGTEWGLLLFALSYIEKNILKYSKYKK